MACKDGDGNNLYVARAYGSERPGVAYPEKYKVRNISSSCEDIHGIWLSKFFTMFQGVCPGKLVAGCNGVYIGWGEQQHLMEEYEILVQVY